MEHEAQVCEYERVVGVFAGSYDPTQRPPLPRGLEVRGVGEVVARLFGGLDALPEATLVFFG
jgi:hypothetical protein